MYGVITGGQSAYGLQKYIQTTTGNYLKLKNVRIRLRKNRFVIVNWPAFKSVPFHLGLHMKALFAFDTCQLLHCRHFQLFTVILLFYTTLINE